MAVRLLGEAGLSRGDIKILDPGERLLSRWQICTETTGMKFLRSPSVHHLDVKPWDLQNFGGKGRKRKPGFFAAPYRRPSLSLFNKHCEQVIESYQLREMHLQDRASECVVEGDEVVVRTEGGLEIRAEHLVLALGSGDKPRWPEWAREKGDAVQHVFSYDFSWPDVPAETVAVVGGGISAGQIALRLKKEGHRVVMVSRHALREHQFDSDSGWLGPKNMVRFGRERDPGRRRKMIMDARHVGSMPPDVRRPLWGSIQRGEISWKQADVLECHAYGDTLELVLSNEERVGVDRVLLATGFETQRPGGAMLDGLIQSAQLLCASCGYPIVDPWLRWHPRIHVTGPLAELELGPSSRNIAGARRAGDRLVQFMKDQPRKAS